MIFRTVKNLGKELNWYRNKNSIFGLYNNYFLRVGDGLGYKYIEIILPESITDEQREKLRNKLITKEKEYKYNEYAIEGRMALIKLMRLFYPLAKKD